MPQHTACEQCHRVGLVRLERIITGTKVTLSYYCGGCDHTWKVDLPDPRKAARAAPLKPVKEGRRSA
jgi:hypothetical protein